jgi:hypothetical protein
VITHDIGAVVSFASDSAGLVVGVVAVLLATHAISRDRARRLLQRSFRRTVLRQLAEDAPGLGSWPLQSVFLVRARAKRRALAVVRGERTAADELGWLRSLQAALAGHGEQLPFLFADQSDRPLVSRSLGAAWARSYLAYAADLESRVLFASSAPPVLAEEAARARAVAALIADQAAGTTKREAPPIRLRLTADDLLIHSLRPLRDDSASHRHAELPVDLLSTFHHPGEEGRASPPGSLPDFEYDGSLPWLEAHRLERDEASGRMRLHFSFTSRRWSEFQEQNKLRETSAPFSEPDGILTLSLAAIDADDRLLLTRRGRFVSGHRGKVNTLVTGNLELHSRRGVQEDQDANGVPDLTRAMAREAREEVGLALEPSRVHLANLARMWSTPDRGTWVATFAATLDQSAAEIADGVRTADPLEGTWEVGDELFALDVPSTPDELGLLIRSLDRVAGGTTPHAIIGVLVVAGLRGRPLDEVRDAVLSGTSTRPLEDLADVHRIRHPFGVRHP